MQMSFGNNQNFATTALSARGRVNFSSQSPALSRQSSQTGCTWNAVWFTTVRELSSKSSGFVRLSADMSRIQPQIDPVL
jgi:hypothetical protein